MTPTPPTDSQATPRPTNIMTSRKGPPPPRDTTHLHSRKGSSQPLGTGLAAGHSNANTRGGSGPPFSSPFHNDHHRQLEALRSELEAERLRSQEAQRRFTSEVRELRQAAERDRQLLADQLRSKWEQQRTRELRQLQEANRREREAEIRQLLRWKEAELREAQELLQQERDAAMRQARDLQRQLAQELVNRGSKGPGGIRAGTGGSVLLSTKASAKLQEVRGKLCQEVDGEQAALIRHLKAELELERSLFLKYIVERFEGEHNLQKYRLASSQEQQPQQQAKREKIRPRSLESLAAASCSPDTKPASQSPSLNNSLSPFLSSHHHCYEFLDGGIPKDGSDGPLQPQKVLSDALQRDRALEEVSKAPMDPPPEGKGSRWEPVEGTSIAAGQQPQPQGGLSASNYDQLRKQNERLLKVLSELEQQCTLLREENTQLRKNNFPMMEEKVTQLKKKSTELTQIARQLEEKGKNLQESSLKVRNTPVPLSLSGPDVELDKTSLAWPQAKQLKEEVEVPLAKDQPLCLQRECWELQTELAAGIKSPSFLKTIDFASMLGESQGEVLRLQRQLMLKYQKESPQHTKISSNDAISSVIMQETSSDLRLEHSVSPKETAKALTPSVEDAESKAFSVQNGPKSNGKGTAAELGEMETDNISINLLLQNQCSSKLCVFLARHSYNPFDGPNKNPEAELPLTAGEYAYIYGEMAEDGFYEGALMDGRRGMVPSNLIEEASIEPSFVLIEPSEISSHSYNEIGFPCHSSNNDENSDSADEEVCVNVLPSRLGRELCGDQRPVLYPQNLTLIKLFARSILIGWDPPHLRNNWGKVQSYNIYVNSDLYHNVKPSSQMKALIENLDLESYSYRFSMQSITDKGNSEKMQCTLFVGKSFPVAPTFLMLRSLTATSAEITWLPSNSNYTHTIYLNKEKYDETKTGIYWYPFRNLKPNSQYNIEVETCSLNDLAFQENLKKKSTAITFTTPSAGPPNPPLDVQIQPSFGGYLAIHWLPETIDSEGSSNGVKVTGYSIYVNGQKVTEIMSPTAGSLSLAVSRLLIFQGLWNISVRTMSAFGESEDSVPALIPLDFRRIPGSLLPKPLTCTMTHELTFNKTFECEDSYIATRKSISSSLCTHTCSGDTIHVTSKCKESIALPAMTTSWHRIFPSLLMASHNARNEDESNSLLHSLVWKQSSERAVPEATCGRSTSSIQEASKASSIQKPTKIFAEDMQREGLGNCFLSKKIACKSQSNNSKIKAHTVSQYTTVENNLLQYNVESSDANHLSHEPRISSTECLLKKGSYRNVTAHNVHLSKESDGFFAENDIKLLCKALSNLSLCNEKPEDMPVLRIVRHGPIITHNNISDLLDKEGEKESTMNTSGRDNFRPQKQPGSLAELTKDTIITMMSRKQPTASVPPSVSQIGFDSADKNGSERLFVAL